ncbi:MAG: preprotein translocase subunit SecY, partial [Lachnospiraceae bacterium]|nr:preprotein translocase subunit SecY [Lachnospiraceae bacterium]
MFKSFLNAWKVPELRKKMLFTLMIVVLFRLGCSIMVPFIDSAALSAKFASDAVQNSLFGY